MGDKPDKTTVVERRSTPRSQVRYRMDVTCGPGKLLGCIVDLSLGGMRVRCTPGADLAAVNRVRIEFPRWVGLGEGLSLRGRFAWRKPADQNGWFEAGFAVQEPSKQERSTIESLIGRLEQAAREDGRYLTEG